MIGSNTRLVTWLTGALGLLALVGPASATVVCVNSADALHRELLGAAANGEDDEIHLVRGVYGGNFVYTSAEAKGLAVLGGYAEGCLGRSLDPANTILDGQQTGRVLALLAPDVAAEFTLEGLTLLNGKTRAAPDGHGGGLLAQAGTEGRVTLRHSQLLNNVGADGGGAYVRAGSISLTANHIHDNAAREGEYGGGGVSLVGSAELSHNRIQANTASLCGGGILILASNAVLSENHIEDNASPRGGGLCVYNHYSATTLDHNLIEHNAASEGGGVALYGTEPGAALLVANQFLDNRAVSRGGGVLLWGSHHDATVIDNRFVENSAPEGGALYGWLADAVTTLANNSLVAQASPADGGLSLHLAGAATATNAQLDTQPLASHPPLATEGSDRSGGSGDDATSIAPEAEIASPPPAPPTPEAEIVSSPPALPVPGAEVVSSPPAPPAPQAEIVIPLPALPTPEAGIISPPPALPVPGTEVVSPPPAPPAPETEIINPPPAQPAPVAEIHSQPSPNPPASEPENTSPPTAPPVPEAEIISPSPAPPEPLVTVQPPPPHGLGSMAQTTDSLAPSPLAGEGWGEGAEGLQPLLVFSDDFEKPDFTGRWVQDVQNDWFVSTQRAKEGSRAAEIDGPTTDGQLTSIAISPQEATTATITFDWFIESSLDSGEYLAFDVSIDGGGTWTEMARLSGDTRATPAENRWHAVRIGLTGLAPKDQLRLRFRGSLSAGDEDANLDNLSVTVQ